MKEYNQLLQQLAKTGKEALKYTKMSPLSIDRISRIDISGKNFEITKVYDASDKKPKQVKPIFLLKAKHHTQQGF